LQGTGRVISTGGQRQDGSPHSGAATSSRPDQGLTRLITDGEIETFHRDGAAHLRQVIPDGWINRLRRGFERLESHFGPDALIRRPDGGTGRYVNEQDRWRVIPEFYDFAIASPAAQLAAIMMGSQTVNFFMDQYFIKDEGVVLPTPWHQDLPYLSVSGNQVMRLWVPTDPVPREMSLEVALGSHRTGAQYRPVQPAAAVQYQYDETLPQMPTLDEIRQRWSIRSWDVEPGDCLAFHVALLHGSPGGTVNDGGGRRRVAAYLWAGDDARYTIRPGRNMPPLPVAGVEDGGRLDSPAFPRVWPRPVPEDLAALCPSRPADC
jgi:ectoine hydroxylase-related dioxygenase (phytanoyl-CoA dioxygenase family)